MFKVYQNGEKKQPTYLRLVDDGDDVSLIACDENGERVYGGYILSITPSGRIIRHTSVNEGLGFDLDDSGRVRETDEEED